MPSSPPSSPGDNGGIMGDNGITGTSMLLCVLLICIGLLEPAPVKFAALVPNGNFTEQAPVKFDTLILRVFHGLKVQGTGFDLGSKRKSGNILIMKNP